jgi:hypothetical protein
MEKVWNFFKKAGDVLNGNKTIICTSLWLMISKDIIPLGPEWQSVLEYILGAAAGGSLIHHAKKGAFKSNKK